MRVGSATLRKGSVRYRSHSPSRRRLVGESGTLTRHSSRETFCFEAPLCQKCVPRTPLVADGMAWKYFASPSLLRPCGPKPSW